MSLDISAAAWAKLCDPDDSGCTDLVALWEIASTPPIYYVTAGYPLVYTPAGESARTYQPEPSMVWEGIGESLETDNPLVELVLQNVDDPVAGELHWSKAFEAADFNDVEVTVRLVMLNTPTAGTHEEIETITGWRISGPRIEADEAVLPIGPRHHLLRLETPDLSIKGSRCVFDYKGRYCGSLSELTTCSKIVAACIKRHPGAPLRFSQMPYHDHELRRRF